MASDGELMLLAGLTAGVVAGPASDVMAPVDGETVPAAAVGGPSWAPCLEYYRQVVLAGFAFLELDDEPFVGCSPVGAFDFVRFVAESEIVAEVAGFVVSCCVDCQ